MASGTRLITNRLDGAQRRLTASVGTPNVRDLRGQGKTLSREWANLSLGRQRAIIEVFLDHGVVGPAVRGRNRSRANRADLADLSLNPQPDEHLPASLSGRGPPATNRHVAASWRSGISLLGHLEPSFGLSGGDGNGGQKYEHEDDDRCH